MSDRPTERSGPRVVHVLWIAGVIAVAGCGNLTAGGFGDVFVSVSGDADSSVTSATSAAMAAGRSAGPPSAPGPSHASGSNEPDGELEAELDLFLVSQAGLATKLNGDEVRVRVDLRGRNEVDALQTFVDATSYTELRMVFTEIRAEVESGLIIGGVPILGEVRVEIDDANIAVSRSLDFVIRDGERVELLIDLNAAAWLEAVDPVTKTVDATVFADLIAVVVR